MKKLDKISKEIEELMQEVGTQEGHASGSCREHAKLKMRG